MDKGAWQATVHRVSELDMTEPLPTAELKLLLYLPHLGCRGCYWFITGAIDLQRGGSWAGQTTKQEEIRLKSLKCLGEEGAATWAESWHEKWPPGYGDTLFHYRVSHQQGPCKLQTFRCKRVFACPVAQVINSSCVW